MILRRTILAALAAMAATASLAQTPAGRAPVAAAGPDQEYVRQTLTVSAMALAVSRVAAEKAQTEDLKEFARLEEAEQETLSGILKPGPAQNAGRDPRERRSARQPGDAEVEQYLDLRGREILESLRAQAAGPDFDRAYMGAMATGHLELMRIQEAYLDSGRNDVNLTNVARLARGMIKEHLQFLADIETGMETASAATGIAPGKNR
jgi:predicted outer membrane protein